MEGCCFMNFLSSRIRENEIVLGSRIIISVDLLHKLGCSVRLWIMARRYFREGLLFLLTFRWLNYNA